MCVPFPVQVWYKEGKGGDALKRILLMLVAACLCTGLAVGTSSCQVMTDEEISSMQDEYYNRGRASVDIEVDEMEAQLDEKRTEGYAEGFDRGYDAGYENGKKDGIKEAGEASEEAADSSSSSAVYSGGTTSSSSSSTEGSGYASQSAMTVYVTDTGSKYHSYGCQYLRESCHGMTLYQAKQAGYTACSRCDPPA